MMKFYLGFLFFLFLLCDSVKVFSSAPIIPPGWELVENSQQFSLPVTLTFAVKQRNIHILQQIFDDVSNPRSERFREHLTHNDLIQLIAPKDSEINLIKTWLLENKVLSEQITLNPSKDFLIVNQISSRIASRLLDCSFRIFRHSNSKQIAQVCLGGYRLPDTIGDLVDFVGGVDYFPKTRFQLPVPDRIQGSSAPYIVKASPGDGNFGLFVLPYCSSGNPSTTTNLDCGSGLSISGLNIFTKQYLTKRQLFLSRSELICGNCSFWPAALQSLCQQTNSQFKLSGDSIYCQTRPITELNLQNYVNVDLNISAEFTNTAQSDIYVYPNPFFLGEFVTPQTLKNYYGITDQQSIMKQYANSQSVAEFLGQYYSPQDLIQFFKLSNVFYPGRVELVGPNNITEPGLEASLDIQFIMGLAQNVTTYFWSLGNRHMGQEPFLEWITQVLNSPTTPWVHSVSYGDDENSLNVDYITRINTEFMKAGTVGLTILVSSGDNGVNSAFQRAPSCSVTQQFVAGFPASSPYVTAVGGTQFTTQTEAICGLTTEYGVPITCSSNSIGEIVASIATGARITSGGGFSNVFPMPSYQQQAVNHYINSIRQTIPSGFYNSSGRAYPDISACARNFLVVRGGTIHPTDGTSAAAPTAAAMMTIINDKLLASSGRTLGFINPTLYSLGPENFFDITLGDNNCGEDILSCCPYGFQATPGWDAATGLGSIHFTQFYNSIH